VGWVIEEIVDIDQVSCTKTKKLKLNNNSSTSSPIKTTQLEQDSSGYHYKQSSNSPLLKSNGVTAVLGMLFGDLLFHKKGTPKYFHYSARQVPETRCTPNGDFHTEGRGEIEIKFFDYRNSKEACTTRYC
jgi:hypothetical protein